MVRKTSALNVVLECSAGHRRTHQFVSPEESRLLKACVNASLARCDTCERRVVSCKEEMLS